MNSVPDVMGRAKWTRTIVPGQSKDEIKSRTKTVQGQWKGQSRVRDTDSEKNSDKTKDRAAFDT